MKTLHRGLAREDWVLDGGVAVKTAIAYRRQQGTELARRNVRTPTKHARLG
jgi:hypothetical protein